MNLSEELVSILTSIRDAQGWPLIVGGAVRDHLLNQSPKDFDVEVYRLSVTELLQILNKFGKTDQVGISFGIIKLHSHQGNEYDFSLPRRENGALLEASAKAGFELVDVALRKPNLESVFLHLTGRELRD